VPALLARSRAIPFREAALRAGVAVGCVAAALLIAVGTAEPHSSPGRLIIPILALSGAVIALSLRVEFVFLGWLFAAPLLQASADAKPVGHVLVLAFYVAPPLLLLTWTLTKRGQGTRHSALDVLPAVYAAYVVGSLVLTTSNLSSNVFGTAKAVWVTMGIGVVLYYFAAFGPLGTLRLVAIVRAFLLTVVLQEGMAIVDGLTGWNLWGDTGWRAGVARAVSTLENPGVLGTYVGMGMAIALSVLVWRGPPSLRRLSTVVFVLGLPALFLTFTRGPIIAVVAVGAIIAMTRSETRLVALGTLAVATVLIVASWGDITGTTVYRDRVANRSNVQARVLIQDWSIKLAQEKPLFGWGYGSFDRVKNEKAATFASHGIPVVYGTSNTSHSTYLTVLVEYGGVGLLLGLAPLLLISWRGANRARVQPDARWLLTGLVGAVVVYAVSASTLDMRFFSLVPSLPWLFLGFLRRHELAARDA
jgi:O-antigen ligase